MADEVNSSFRKTGCCYNLCPYKRRKLRLWRLKLGSMFIPKPRNAEDLHKPPKCREDLTTFFWAGSNLSLPFNILSWVHIFWGQLKTWLVLCYCTLRERKKKLLLSFQPRLFYFLIRNITWTCFVTIVYNYRENTFSLASFTPSEPFAFNNELKLFLSMAFEMFKGIVPSGAKTDFYFKYN